MHEHRCAAGCIINQLSRCSAPAAPATRSTSQHALRTHYSCFRCRRRVRRSAKGIIAGHSGLPRVNGLCAARLQIPRWQNTVTTTAAAACACACVQVADFLAMDLALSEPNDGAPPTTPASAGIRHGASVDGQLFQTDGRGQEVKGRLQEACCDYQPAVACGHRRIEHHAVLRGHPPQENGQVLQGG